MIRFRPARALLDRLGVSSGAAPRHQRWTRSFLSAALERSAVAAAALVGIMLAIGVALVYASGGTDHAPPHWFYFPVLFAGLRFGVAGGVGAGLVAAVLAGPLAPADVVAGTTQRMSEWSIRGVFFVGVGAVMPLLLARTTVTVQQERRARRTEDEVHRALTRDEFVLHYQPIIALDGGQIVGVEALLRWQHPERGLLTPADFLDEIERIGSIDTWVLGEACRQARSWRDELLDGDRPFVISVNVSAAKLSQPDFAHQVRGALEVSGLDPYSLCLEVTETALIDDLDTASARLEVLRSLGVKIAVDDYGTGHSSLVYLLHLPVDHVKIDREFVAGLHHDSRDRAIVENVITLARSLGATCVAEGVETVEQLDAVTSLGCLQAQGYLFARPQPAEQIPALLTVPSFVDVARLYRRPTERRPLSRGPGRRRR